VVFLQDVKDLLAPTVRATLGSLALGDEDQAAAALAVEYAKQIDDAEAAGKIAERAISTLLRDGDAEDRDHEKYVYALAAKVEAATLLAQLGPKLLAVLESLGATPAARARLKGGKPANAVPSKLSDLRAARSRPA
jgi:hypothetical protein